MASDARTLRVNAANAIQIWAWIGKPFGVDRPFKTLLPPRSTANAAIDGDGVRAEFFDLAVSHAYRRLSFSIAT